MLKSDAVRFGWLHVMLNTWQCWFCSHHPREQLAIKSRAHACLVNHISTEEAEAERFWANESARFWHERRNERRNE